MTTTLRNTGIEVIGSAPWSTHFCEFYQSKEDLLGTLVPYFKAGLEASEFCMWVTADPLTVADAESAMRKAVPDFDKYVKKHQMAILPHDEWYQINGVFNMDRVLSGWLAKYDEAISRGFEGIRVTGNTAWLEKKDWKDFRDYEAAINGVVGRYKMLVLCTYSLEKCSAAEIIDVINNHEFALIKQDGEWRLVQNAIYRQARDALATSEQKYRALYSTMGEGVALHEVVYDSEGKPVDYVIIDVNPAYESILNLKKEDVIGKKASEMYGTGKAPFLDVYAAVAASGDPAVFETYFPPMDRYFNISVSSQKKGTFATVFSDISERRRNERDLKRSTDKSALLSEASNLLLSNEVPERIVQTICKKVMAFLDCQVFFNYLIDENQKRLRLNAYAGVPEKTGRSIEWLDLGVAVCGCVARDGVRIVAENIQETPDPRTELVKSFGVKAYACHPIMVQGRTIGTLSFGTKTKTSFTGEELDFMKTVTDQVATAMERKRAGETLRESERKYRQLIETATEGVWVVDNNGVTTYVNQRMAEILGGSVPQVIGTKRDDFIAPEYLPYMNEVRKLRRKGISNQFELKMKRLDGSAWWALISGSPIYDAAGKHVGNLGMHTDITERKQAEENLFREKVISDTTIESLPGIFYLFDERGRFLKWNRNFERVSKFTAGEISQMHPLDFFRGQDKERVAETIQKVFSSGEASVAADFVAKDGQKIPHFFTGRMSVIDNTNCLIGTGLDVTERKKAEEALIESEEKYRNIVETAFEGIMVTAPDGKILFVNQRLADMLGYSREEMIGKIGIDFADESYRDLVMEMRSELKTGTRLQKELPLRRKNGDPVWTVANISPLLGTDGRHTGNLTMYTDITTRRKAEEALAELNGELEERVKERTSELERSNRQLNVEITEREQAEQELRLFVRVLEQLSRGENRRDTLTGILRLIKEYAGVEVAAMRLREGDDFPYYVVSGFPERFVEQESSLCVRNEKHEIVRDAGGNPQLDCLCGIVIMDAAKPALPGFTEGKSFWTNRSSEFLATVIKEKVPIHARARCMAEGYESLALIPLRLGEETIGLLQLNDRREGRLTPRLIRFLEELAMSIGTAVKKIQAEERVSYLATFPQLNPSLIVELDMSGNVTYANPAMKAVFDSIDKKGIEHPYFTGWTGMITECRGQGNNYTRQLELSGRWYEQTVHCLSEPERVRIYGRDITIRKKAEEALRTATIYARSLIEASLDPLVTINRDGKITDVNAATERVTGASREKLIGADFSDYFTEPEKARAGYEKVFSEGLVRDYPLSIRNASGETTDVLYNASVYKNEAGEVQGVFAAARDITERKKLEEALRAANIYSRSLIEASLDPLVTINRDGKITDVNAATERVTGITREKLIGTDFSEYFTAPDKAREGYQEVFTKGFVIDYPLTIRHISGETTDVLYNASVYWNEAGEVQGVFAAARDITERKKLEEALRAASLYARSLIEASLDPLVTISRDGKITDVNAATELVTGVPRENLVGTDFSSYFTEPDKAREGYQQVFSLGMVKDYPLTIRHLGGQTVDVLYNASTFKNEAGEVRGVFAAARDITERKRLENELRRSNDELQQFAYVTSHDLQEPLRMISSYLQLIERRYKGKLDSDADEFIGYAVDGATRLRTMINDLLEYSRIQTRGKPFEPTPAGETVRTAIGNLEIAIKESQAVVTCGPLPTVDVDATQFVRLFQNLIGNALKFHGNDPPRVHVSAVKKGDEWVFSVRDNGIGIDPQYQGRLFVIFQRLHTRDEYPGTGIGLAVCKRIVERHKGRIWVESEAGNGATFCFTIPVGGK